MIIDILHFHDCPHHAPAAALAREVIAAMGLEADVREVLIRGPEEAQDRRFLGSPTIQIDGRDIEPAARARTDFGFGCRLYGRSGVPPREVITAAFKEASDARGR